MYLLQERLRQNAIKEKEKERREFYQKQKEEAKLEWARIRAKVLSLLPKLFKIETNIFQYNLAPTPEPSDEDIDTSDEDDEFGGGGRNDNPEDQTASKKSFHNTGKKESLIFRSQGPCWKTNEWSLGSGSRKMYYSVMEDKYQISCMKKYLISVSNILHKRCKNIW